jgi:predicted ferric reductase
MNLIPHAWTVLKYAWSVRLMALASILIFLEPVISTGAQYVTVKSVWVQMGVASLIGLVGVAAIWARVTFQTTLRTKIAEKEAANGEPLS